MSDIGEIFIRRYIKTKYNGITIKKKFPALQGIFSYKLSNSGPRG